MRCGGNGDEEFDFDDGDFVRGKVNTAEGEVKEQILMVTDFTERFGCSSGQAFKVVGHFQLIHPKHVTVIRKIPVAEHALLIPELHTQGCELTRWYSDKLEAK